MHSLRNKCRLVWTWSKHRTFRTMDNKPQYKIKTRKIVRLNKGVKDRPSPNIYIDVVSPGGRHGTKSVLLFTENSRYLFNCGEGSQRYLNEMRGRLDMIDDLFITHNSWENIGGLLGLLLSTTNVEHPNNQIRLHCPPRFDLTGFTRNAAAFSEQSSIVESDVKHYKKGIIAEIDKRTYDSGPYIDSQIRVDYVPLRRDDVDAANGSPTRQPNGSDAAYWKDSYENYTKEKALSDQKRRELDIAVAFIITPSKMMNKVSMEKVFALGLKAGRWLKKITEGESVVVDGKEVHPDDITYMPDGKGPIIVLECPSKAYLRSLVMSEQLRDLCNDPKTVPEVIVHMSPVDVVDHPDYRAFMDRFGTATKHLMLNERSRAPILYKALEFNQNLHLLNPRLFPDVAARHMIQEPSHAVAGNIVQGQYFLRCIYRDKDRGGFVLLDKDKDIISTDEEKMATFEPEIVSKIRNLHDKLEKFEKTKAETNRYPEIVFLGTGASVPSKIRNVTCYLVHTNASSCMLLDCGESSIIQLLQFYGDEADSVLCKLKAIFISHVHLDHHGGVIGIVKARDAALKRAGYPPSIVNVVCPLKVWNYFVRYNEFVGPLSDSLRSTSHSFYMSADKRAVAVANAIKQRLDLNQCQLVPVKHSMRMCFGVMLEGTQGWKVVFSGDTRPCESLVNAGKDCDILLHEATFENTHAADALRKAHSTIEEAISIGEQMNAKYTMLTHFSSRIVKVPESITTHPPNVGIAFDFMMVNLNNLPSVQMHEEALKSIYQEPFKDYRNQERMKLEQRNVRMFGEKRLADSPEEQAFSDSHLGTCGAEADSLKTGTIFYPCKTKRDSDTLGRNKGLNTLESKSVPSETNKVSELETIVTECTGNIKDSDDKHADRVIDRSGTPQKIGSRSNIDDVNSTAVKADTDVIVSKATDVNESDDYVSLWETSHEVAESCDVAENLSISSGDKMADNSEAMEIVLKDTIADDSESVDGKAVSSGDQMVLGTGEHEHVNKKQKLVELGDV